MPQKSKVIFAALAAAATLGAAQIAAGEAFSSASLADRFDAVGEPAGAAGINRTAKGDREAKAAPDEATRTVLLKVESLADTSVLVRIPLQKDAKGLPPLSKPAADKAKKMTVACEPPVSVLTEVAKLLQPGRCVT
jgi:acyl-coenzyme A synthetase/AMP-(fatty) acid ligase